MFVPNEWHADAAYTASAEPPANFGRWRRDMPSVFAIRSHFQNLHHCSLLNVNAIESVWERGIWCVFFPIWVYSAVNLFCSKILCRVAFFLELSCIEYYKNPSGTLASLLSGMFISFFHSLNISSLCCTSNGSHPMSPHTAHFGESLHPENNT